MAIFPRQGSHSNPEPSQPFKIDFWTEEATRSLRTISLASPGSVRRTVESITIPLEEDLNTRRVHVTDLTHCEDEASVHRPHREPLRRDSLKRREALLKGKEGSRRRQRWENGSC